MNISNNMKVRGDVTITRTDKDGNVFTHHQQNLVTDQGIAFFASKIFDKKSLAYQNVGGLPPAENDTINYFISEIAIGTNGTSATKNDTFDNQISLGTKLKGLITNAVINEEEGSFYFQKDFPATNAGTLLDNENVPLPIEEVLLIAKQDDGWNSPPGSIVSPKLLICRTALTTPFTKYTNDRISVSWKLRIG